jgi:plasmid segregation protein ParM
MNTFCLGLDIGYSNLKVVMGTTDLRLTAGAAAGAPRILLSPAGAAPADRMPERIRGKEEPAVLRVQVGEEAYVACVSLERLQDWNRVLHSDYPGTSSYRALFHAALLLSERDTVERVVTGLPVAHYQDRKRRQALVDRLEGEHQITPKRKVRVEKADVIPQPVGGYMDYASQATDLNLLKGSRMLVVDPGFFSFDWVFIVNGDLRQSSSGTSQQATSVILEETDRYLEDDYGGRVGRERLEQALRLGMDQVMLYGQPVAIAPYLDKAADRIVPVALAAMREALRNEGDADIVLLTGGGARFFATATRELFPRSQVVVAPEPVYANARGFWFYGSLED